MSIRHTLLALAFVLCAALATAQTSLRPIENITTSEIAAPGGKQSKAAPAFAVLYRTPGVSALHRFPGTQRSRHGRGCEVRSARHQRLHGHLSIGFSLRSESYF